MSTLSEAQALFEVVDDLLITIEEKCESLVESLKTAIPEALPQIDADMAALADEHARIMPQWKACRSLINTELIKER